MAEEHASMSVQTLRRILYSAGRLFDFSGGYTLRKLEERFSTPGWMRDRQNMKRDGEALRNDIVRATRRLERYCGKIS